jgi:ParB family chromosome partitioning protein
MAEDKKNIPETAPPAEAPAPAVENAVVPEQPISESTLADAETVMLEHEGQAVLFEMGEAVPDPADAVTHAEVDEPATPEVPQTKKEQAQPPTPGKDAPAPAHSGKVVDFAAAREEAAKEEKKAIKQKPPKEKGKATKPGKGRPSKAEKAAPEQGKPPKAGKTHAAPEEKAAPPAPEVPPTPRDATRAEKEEIVYLDLSDLHPFKDHPFGVRDDAEMKSLVESVRNGGVNQPALVRPREGGGYEIIAGHRRQMASQLAGYRNMPCIVRNMTDDEAILAMTDDNLRQRETILPSEKAMSLKMQYEAIKHQGARGDSAEAGKLSLESVGQRNGMSVKTVQRYIWLNDLVPELKQTMDDGKLSFTPAVEISRVRPKHQKYIAVSIEGQQASPSKGQAKRLRELDKENKLSPDVIDGILCEEKKKEDRDVIITGAELEKFFGKEATPRQMKDQIMTLLEDWKERQPPEFTKPDKKMDMEK